MLPSTRRQFLGGLAAAPLLRGSDPLSAPLLAKVRIGAEFFLNAGETRESVFRHFERMAETGLTIARIFTIWDHVEREKGKWDFSGYDWIYEAAQKHGVYVANTLCAEDPPGWMGTAPFYHAWRDISDPKLRPYAEIYIEKVVNRYKNHPAHGVWLLQNEPAIRIAEEPYVFESFARWLEKRYGTVEVLNKVWYRPLRTFAEVRAPVEPRAAGWADYPSNLDWRRFQCDHLVDQLNWIRAQIEKHHPGALTHINPAALTSNMIASGRDMWKMRSTAHFVGATMHAAWQFTMFAREDYGVAYGFCCDLIRSVSAPQPWWVTELQAGPTILTGSRPLNPTGGEVTRWLWDGVGNGVRGIVYWLWHPRTEGNEAGEWGLAGPQGEPTGRTKATQAVAVVLKRHEDFFASARPVPARCAILYNVEALTLYLVDGFRRPDDVVMDSLMGCYKALHRAHVPVDFLSTGALESGKASAYQVLYLPFSYALSARSVAAIGDYVRNGGTVWADGLVGWKDEQGKTRQLPPGPLSDVFGFTLDDIEAESEPFSLTGGADKAGELWRCLIPRGKAATLLTGPGGRPAAVEHRFGKGRAIYYGTGLTFRSLRHEDRAMIGWIAGPGIAASRDLPVRLVSGPDRFCFRTLQAPGRMAAVLNNWGAAAEAVLSLPASARSASDIISGQPVTVRRTATASEARIHIPAGGSAVLMLVTG